MSTDSTGLSAYFTTERGVALLGHLETDAAPAHVAIIMDGNGRWAQARRKPRVFGHRAGAKALREAIETAIELRVRYLTIYSFSSENWSRSSEEVTGLMRLFVEVLQAQLASLMGEGVRLRLIGDRTGLPEDVCAAFESAESKTADNTTLDLLVALNYGARQELAIAVRALARRVSDGELSADAIDESMISASLLTAPAPDPDLVIRTSGEMRVSNFLLWQIAYSELWITDTLWPDFDRDDFLEAVVEYQSRQRRFGG